MGRRIAAEDVPVPDESRGTSEAELERRFRRRLVIFAVRRLGDNSLAEDVSQETLKRVLEALREGRVRSLDSLPGFVYQTARHLCQQWHRKTGREQRALERLSQQPQPSSRSDPLSNLIGAERRAAVSEALVQLEQSDRELLRMLYYEESGYVHISETLKLTPGALRTRKHRALARLREVLGRGVSNGDSGTGT